MADIYSNNNPGLTGPLQRFQLATPSGADVTLTNTSRGILITGAGALVIQQTDGTDFTFASGALAVGVWHPIRAQIIRNTGTGATGIIAGW